jgi:lipopolysaccharide transport system permease protein
MHVFCGTNGPETAIMLLIELQDRPKITSSLRLGARIRCFNAGMETDYLQRLSARYLVDPSRSSKQYERVVIRPTSGWVPINFRDLWDYRELLYFLTWRDIKVRYKQTALGVAWVVLQPLFLMLVFTLFFGRLVGVPSDGIPYSIFTYTALLPWQLFSRALNEASVSLVANERIITKIYFPRVLVPVSAVLSSLVDFTIGLAALVGFMLLYGIQPGFAILALPLFVLLAVMAALGVSLWLAALNVVYRDVRYMLPFLTQIWMFATPIIYPVSVVPEAWRTLYSLNPMAGVVEGFRWSLLGSTGPSELILALSVAIVLLIFGAGILYFWRFEQTLADVI